MASKKHIGADPARGRLTGGCWLHFPCRQFVERHDAPEALLVRKALAPAANTERTWCGSLYRSPDALPPTVLVETQTASLR
jgi:hypothetical protein